MARLNLPLFIALAASILSAIDARGTLPHQRMIRKRSASLGHFEARAAAFVVPRWPGLQERQLFGDESTSSVASRTSSAVTSASSSSSSSRPTTSSQSTSAIATTTSASASQTSSAASSTGGLLDSLTGILGGTQSSTSVSSTSSSSSSSSVPTSSSAPTSAAAPSTTAPAVQTPVNTPTLNIATPPPVASESASPSAVIITSTVPPEAQESKKAAAARTQKIAKNTIISLVVIASCIGGAVAIWTVIRKWKLSPSERFDDRMQPIDWAPSGGVGGVREETVEEKSHRRVGSNGSHGSFTSGGVGQSEVGHGGARSVHLDQHGHGAQAQDLPPQHDFTAVPNNYGQYNQQYAGGAGYADLQRGPSVTESNYSHSAGVTRGLSYSRGGAGYEAQPGAGGVPPMPNPYGGGYEYEDYGHQAGHGQVQVQGQYRGY